MKNYSNHFEFHAVEKRENYGFFGGKFQIAGMNRHYLQCKLKEIGPILIKQLFNTEPVQPKFTNLDSDSCAD
mgnify:CR=1 FL=1